MDLRALLARFLALPWVVATRTVLDTYGRAAGGLLANGLAFSALFAAIPIVLLVLGIAGWVGAGDESIREQVRAALVSALPPLADLVTASVSAVSDGAALTSLVGVVGVLWTAGQLFVALDVAFARIFSDEPERNTIRRTVRGFVVVAILSTTVVAIIGSLALVAALDTLGERHGSLARGAAELLGSAPMLAVVTSLAIVAGYRMLPPHPPSWRALIIPGVLVGMILVVLSQVFTYLVPRLVGVAQLAGPLASGFVALAWLSLSFQALLLGAAWVRVRNAGPPPDVRASRAPAGSASLERPAATAETGSGGE